MKAVRLMSPGRIDVVEVADPIPADGELRLKVAAVGICGSDMHAVQGLHPFIRPPIILGHEIAGRVDQVGPGVHGFEAGELVTVEPSITCGKRYNCRIGRYNICEDPKVVGAVGQQGAMAEYVVVPTPEVFRVPTDWSVEKTAMVEPTAYTLSAKRRSGTDKTFGLSVPA